MKVGTIFDALYPVCPVDNLEKKPLVFPPPDPFFSKAGVKRLFVAPPLPMPELTIDERYPCFYRTWIHPSDTLVRRIFKLATAIFLLVPLWAYLHDRKQSVLNIARPGPTPVTRIDRWREGVTLDSLFPVLRKVPVISSIAHVSFSLPQVVKGLEFLTISFLACKICTWVGDKGTPVLETYMGSSSRIVRAVHWLFRPVVDISLPLSSIPSLSSLKGLSFLKKVPTVASHAFAWVQGKEDYPFSFAEKLISSVSKGALASKDSRVAKLIQKVIPHIETFFSSSLHAYILGNVKPFPSSSWTCLLNGKYMFQSFTKITPFTWDKVTYIRDSLNYAIRGVNRYVSLWQNWVVTPVLSYGSWRWLTRPPIESLLVSKVLPEEHQKSFLERAIVKLCS